MNNEKIAVIGEKNSLSAFKAVGVDVFSSGEVGSVGELLKKLVKMDYAIILITDDIAEHCKEEIFSYKNQAYPIILPIPSTKGSTGFGIKGLKYNIEKAIGMDIVFNKEGKE